MPVSMGVSTLGNACTEQPVRTVYRMDPAPRPPPAPRARGRVTDGRSGRNRSENEGAQEPPPLPGLIPASLPPSGLHVRGVLPRVLGGVHP